MTFDTLTSSTMDLRSLAVGTGRLGRPLPKDYKVRMCETILRALEHHAHLHVSPTYGRSFEYLKRFHIPEHARGRTIAKVDFSEAAMPELQIRLTRRLFPDVPFFEVQIAGDLRPLRMLQNHHTADFFAFLDRMKRKYGISRFYFSPLYHDCNSFEPLAGREDVSWAVHCSLVEREFTEDFLARRVDGEKMIFLRAFGDGIQRFGDWYCPPSRYTKPAETFRAQRDNLTGLLDELDITEDAARLFYALHHPKADLLVMSLSKGWQLDKLVEVVNMPRDDALWSSLDAYSKAWANLGRRRFGFAQPPNLSYMPRHGLVSLLRAGIGTGDRRIATRVLQHCGFKALGLGRIKRKLLKGVN